MYGRFGRALAIEALYARPGSSSATTRRDGVRPGGRRGVAPEGEAEHPGQRDHEGQREHEGGAAGAGMYCKPLDCADNAACTALWPSEYSTVLQSLGYPPGIGLQPEKVSNLKVRV